MYICDLSFSSKYNVFSFVVFNGILFALNQQDSVFNSLLTVVIRLGSEVPDTYTVKWSAKIIALRMSNEFGKSFMYTRNNKGPRTHPCGTLQVTVGYSM